MIGASAIAVKPAGSEFAVVLVSAFEFWFGESEISKVVAPAAGSIAATNRSAGREAGALPVVTKLGGGTGAKSKISFGSTPERSILSSTSSSTRFAKPTGPEFTGGRFASTVGDAGGGVFLRSL